MDIDVAMVTIYIHATRADVLAAQLFGRIADEPSQLMTMTTRPPYPSFAHYLMKTQTTKKEKSLQKR